jgi:hypothetical protein
LLESPDNRITVTTFTGLLPLAHCHAIHCTLLTAANPPIARRKKVIDVSQRMLLASDGFPARTPLVRTSTRQRKPARPRPDDPRKTVKPTPRGKYGLGPRKERPLQLDEAGPASRSSSSSSGSEAHVQVGASSNQIHAVPGLSYPVSMVFD